MYNLLNFLVKNSFWFFFIILEVLSFYFIFSDNSYQRSVFFNSSNELSGRVYTASAGVTSYFGLKSENESLLEKTGELQNRITFLENHIFKLENDSTRAKAYLDTVSEKSNEYIVAKVLNNSISHVKNYITINKGSKDGVEVRMGVISHRGVVGEVRAVSNNFSVVQSLLNSDSRFSSKLTRSQAFAPVEWTDYDPRFVTMKEYPGHELVAVGDTVVTSGYSDIFPSGVFVGTVHSYEKKEELNQYELLIELSTDFNSLSNVLVVKRDFLKEKQELEKTLADVKN